MKGKIMWVAAAVLLSGVAFIAGRHFGRSDEIAMGASGHAMFEVSLLDCLYAGDTNRVKQVLEYVLDLDTDAMATVRGRILTRGTRNQLKSGISRVVRFRREHPRTPFPVPQEDWQQTDAKEWRDFVQTQSEAVRELNSRVDKLFQEENEKGPTPASTLPAKSAGK